MKRVFRKGKKRAPVYYFAAFVILGSLIVYHFFAVPWLVFPQRRAVQILTELAYTSALVYLVQLRHSDPGVIPVAEGDRRRECGNGPLEDIGKIVAINDVTVGLKICRTCGIERPPRASHCSKCDRCVDVFDHHCIWIGNCVGKRNYRMFFAFLVLCMVSVLLMLGQALWNFVYRISHSETRDIVAYGFRGCWGMAVAMVPAVVAYFGAGSMMGYNCKSTWSNRTQREKMKEMFPRHANPFSLGRPWRNFAERLFSPQCASFEDPRLLAKDR